MLVHLDNLDTSIRAIADLQICRKGDPRKAECAIASLVEAIDKGDVEVGGVIAADGEIDECIGPRMASSEDHRTSVDWPLGSVGVRYGLVYSTTCKPASWSIAVRWGKLSLRKHTWSLPLRWIRITSPVGASGMEASVRRQSRIDGLGHSHDAEMSPGWHRQRQRYENNAK